MAVTIIDNQTYDGSYVATHTFTDVDVSGTDTLHIAVGFNRNPASEATSWTSDGNTMVSITEEINANVVAVSAWYYKINNSTVTTVSNTPSFKLQTGITAGLAGVNQTTPIVGTTSTQNYGASATTSYTGVSGNLLAVFVATKDDRTFTASNCTSLVSITGADANMGSGFLGYVTATGSSQTIGANWTTDTNWAIVVAEINAAAVSVASTFIKSPVII